MLKKILVAYDGSESAGRAFRFALDLAKPFEASITILAVAIPPEPPTMVETKAMLENATEHYEQLFSKLRDEARDAGIAVQTKVVIGHPADQVVHVAAQERMDLIVMGHRGKSMISRWLLGSVSKRDRKSVV